MNTNAPATKHEKNISFTINRAWDYVALIVKVKLALFVVGHNEPLLIFISLILIEDARLLRTLAAARISFESVIP